jgi:hypothetical protein
MLKGFGKIQASLPKMIAIQKMKNQKLRRI